MIVVDSSALVAIFEGEPDAAAFAQAIAIADRLLISAVNVFETGIVLGVCHGNAAPARLWRFLEERAASGFPGFRHHAGPRKQNLLCSVALLTAIRPFRRRVEAGPPSIARSPRRPHRSRPW